MASVIRNMRARAVAFAVAALLALCGLALAVPGQACATGGSGDAAVGADELVGLTVYDQHDGCFAADCEVRIYHVATVGADGALVPTSAFAGYPVSWDVPDSASAQVLADTLEGYVARDGVSPTDSGLTDANGVIVFPKTAAQLNSGYYLVLADNHEVGEEVHVASSVLLPLPYVHESGGVDYAPGVTLKNSVFAADEPITIDATKVWEGEDANRPAEVQVQLLRDRAVYDIATLNAANGWHVAWTDLDPAYEWNVAEVATPNNYLTSVKRDGLAQDAVSFTVTNTYVPEDENLPPTDEEKLPQTGQLWWPVPLLLLAGAACLAVGASRKNKA